MSKLVTAIVFYKNGEGHQFVKFFADASEVSIAPQNYQMAIDAARDWQWRERAYFINEAPALVWAKVGPDITCPQPLFLDAWEKVNPRPLACAARFSRHPIGEDRYSIPVGDVGYIVPTRSKDSLRRLARRYPSVMRDKMWLPVDLIARIHERNVKARRERQARQESINAWLQERRGKPRCQLMGADFRPH